MYRLLCLTTFLLAISTNSVLCACNLLQSYYIRSTTTGLTIDAAESSAVRLQYFNGLPSQRWKIECGIRPGYFYIVNDVNGDVLDVTRDANLYVVVNQRDGSLYQQWSFNHKGRIYNSATGYVMSIESGFLTPGSLARLYGDNDSLQQQFLLVEQQ